MSRRTLKACGTFLLMLALATGVAADDDRHRGPVGELQMGADRIVGGGSFSVTEPVTGDLIVAGGNVDIDAAVGGDLLAAGGNLRIGEDVAQSVYAAGGHVKIAAKIGRNLRLAGGQIEVGPKAQIGGNVSVAGGDVELRGTVNGYLQVAGGQVLIDGPVGGDVVATSAKVSLGPNARIAGKLKYRSAEELQRDPAAQVAGGIEQLPGPAKEGRQYAERRRWHGGFGIVWTLGMMLLVGVLLAAAPNHCDRVARTLRERTGASVLLGFVWLVCAPVAAVVMLATVVGIPLGLIAIAIYLVSLPLAYAGSSIALGGWAVRRWKADRAASSRWRIGAAAIAALLIAVLGWIPVLGPLVVLAAVLAGLGAMLLQLRRAPTPAA